MKYLLNLLNKNKDYLIVLILSFFLSFPYIMDICSGYLNYSSFDLQNFLLWDYTSLKNFLPFKDVFYPYGLFNYYKNYSIIFTILYFLVSPVLLTTIFFLFKRIFSHKSILYSSFVVFCLFIVFFVGFPTFARYGFLATSSLIFAYVFYSTENKETRILIVFGAFLGITFSLIVDQGIYVILVFAFLFTLSKVIFKKQNLFSSKFLLITIKEILLVFVGFIAGIVPLLLFLLYNNSLYEFYDYLKEIGEIVVVAKTPFFAFIDSPANVFTVTIVYFAVFYNFLKLFFLKRRITLSTFFQIALIFDILLLEQKSIIRSIDRQIVFISLMLLMLLVHEIVNYFKSKIVNKKIIYILLILAVAVLYGFNVDSQTINLPHLSKNFNHLLSNKCYENNLKFFLEKNSSYMEIIKVIKRQQNFNGKIFSFPTGDSTFYVLVNQKPPFYNSIFGGASYEMQNTAIEYIRENKIEYVTLNTGKSSLQDGVPDYIRQSLLFKYILNNYYPFKSIGNHLILKKEKDNDFFASNILKQAKDYGSYLLDVYLYKIPFSEGLYKYKYLEKNNKLITESTDIDIINIFLKKRIFYSDNKVIVMIPNANNKSPDLNFIKFQLENEDNTVVYYNSCKANTQCIINLSKAPLFYKKRIITKIILDKGFEGKIKIFDLEKPGNLW